MRITHEVQSQKDKIRENTEKIKVNKTLPYLVSNVIEVSDVPAFFKCCSLISLILNICTFLCNLDLFSHLSYFL